jgi:hypothetical protein
MHLDQLVTMINKLKQEREAAWRVLNVIVNAQNIQPGQIVVSSFHGGDEQYVDISSFLKQNAELLKKKAAENLKAVDDKIKTLEDTLSSINLDV